MQPYLNPRPRSREIEFDSRIDELPFCPRIGFATFCSRLAAGCFEQLSFEEEDRPAVECVLTACEDFAAGNFDKLHEPIAFQALKRLEQSRQKGYYDEDLGLNAQYHAILALEATVRATWDAANSIEAREAVRQARASLRYQHHFADRESGAAIGLIDDVLNNVLNTARRERWTDSTPVKPSVMSPDCSIEREAALIVNDMCVKMCELIARHPVSLLAIEWRQLEQVIATTLEGLGFSVQLTPSSKDGGKDVVAQCFFKGQRSTYFIEVKHWRKKPVPFGPVEQFVEVTARDGVAGGLFLSTSGFASHVFAQLAVIEERRIRLGTDVKIVSLCQEFVQGKGQATWRAQEVLPRVLTEKTVSR